MTTVSNPVTPGFQNCYSHDLHSDKNRIKSMKPIEYYKQLHRDVWQGFSTEALSRYYDKKVIGQSGKVQLNFDEIYGHLSFLKEHYTSSTAQFHHIMSIDNRVMVWLTQTPIRHDGKADYALNTMASYEFKDDKIISLEFIWDKPIDLVMPSLTHKPALPLKNATMQLESLLSPRELECFFHVIQNKTSKQIAQNLGLSHRTIETYLDSMKQKLGFHTLSQVTDYAIAQGLLAISPLLAQAIQTDLHGRTR